MYLMYVDESGDPGANINSPTKYFILTGIIIHELSWKSFLDDFVTFRRALKQTKGLRLREEIHATALISRPGVLIRISRNDRLDIMRQCINWLAARSDASVISVCVNKHKHVNNDIFTMAWSALIQRFENTLTWKNFNGPQNQHDKGLILSDNTDGKKLTALIRKLRYFNIVPNMSSFGGGSRNLKIIQLVEDPFLKDSATSYFHQLCDVVAYCARQKYEPNLYMKKKGGVNFYDRLLPIIILKASPRHPLGIVEI